MDKIKFSAIVGLITLISLVLAFSYIINAQCIDKTRDYGSVIFTIKNFDVISDGSLNFLGYPIMFCHYDYQKLANLNFPETVTLARLEGTRNVYDCEGNMTKCEEVCQYEKQEFGLDNCVVEVVSMGDIGYKYWIQNQI